VLLELETTDIEAASALIMASRWSGSMRPATSGRLMLDLSRDDVPLMARTMVEQGVGIRSMKPVNSLEAYFLSLTNTPAHVVTGQD
jgi:hypothetical protein